MSSNKDRVVRCPNGHFYDGVAYASCPHCNKDTKPQKTETKSPEKPATWAWNHNNEKRNEPENKNVSSNASSDDMETVSLYYGGMSVEEPVKAPEPVREEPVMEPEVGSDGVEPVSYTAATVESADINSSSDDERTIGYFEAGNKNEQVMQDIASIASYSNQPVVQTTAKPVEEARKDTVVTGRKLSGPVVGWLVSVKGAYLGEYFGISVGNNSVGRSESNKICFSKDRKVSREKHAIITYEPKKREFFVKAGDESGLVYLNDELVMGSHLLCRMDKLEIGDGLYLFVPLCGEDFTWDDYMNRE